MTASAPKPQPDSKAQAEFFGVRETITKIRQTHAQELVIGLCGPIGTPLGTVAEALHKTLHDDYAYNPLTIKLSSLIEEHAGQVLKTDDKYLRYSDLQTKGNGLRERFGHSILAELAVKEILLRRAEEVGAGAAEPRPIRFCHIIDSIKNPSELELLRLVYGSLFLMIGVHASPQDREGNLVMKGVQQKSLSALMDRDSGEDFSHGQEVRKTFPLSDFFINTTNCSTPDLTAKLRRVIELVTKSRIVTPTKAETAMYNAYAVSLNSGCLSRQVGAAVTDSEYNVLGTGWNDVPRFGGGLYTEDSKPDRRCMHESGGKCFNDFEKQLITDEIVGAVISVSETFKAKEAELRAKIRASRVSDLLEFSRAVHAEMMAIINAGTAGDGHRMRGGKVFVTTYPCHSCARHIVAAGISEVYYIEPYRKSLARKLHGDTIAEEGNTPGRVKIVPYEGVGPAKYVELFEIAGAGRKDDATGKMTLPRRNEAVFSTNTSVKSYPSLEHLVLEQLRGHGLAPRAS